MPTSTKPAVSSRSPLLTIIAVAVIYAVLARLGLLLAIPGTNTSPVWPPSGFAFAAVLVFGRRVWPGIALGAFAGNIVTFLHQPPASVGLLLTASIVIALGNTAEAVTGSYVVEKMIGRRSPIDRTQDSAVFVLAAAIMCLVAATVGPTFLCASGIAKWSLYPTIWSTWWLGDTTGILILTPTLLAWSGHNRQRLTPAQVAELALSIAVIIAIALVFFHRPAAYSPMKGQVYLILPPLLWIVFRFHPRYALTTATIVSVIAVYDTVQGQGAFALGSLNTSLEVLQTFISVLAITAMMLGAACTERARAQQEADEHAEHQRTIAAALQSAMQPSDFPQIPGLDLAFYYKAAVLETRIGGDFYDVFPIGDHRYGVLIGDISGKGLRAAIQASSVRNMLRCALYLRDDPAQAVSEINRAINHNELVAGFATALVCIYDSRTRAITHISCGHEPGLIYHRSNGTITPLTTSGPPLGVISFDYSAQTTTLCPGDALLLMTDGITEVRHSDGQLLGTEAVSRMLSMYAAHSTQPDVLVQRIIADVEANSSGPFRDDACVIAVCVR